MMNKQKNTSAEISLKLSLSKDEARLLYLPKWVVQELPMTNHLPPWADKLVGKVCQSYHIRIPVIKWSKRRTTSTQSSGETFQQCDKRKKVRIRISYGTSLTDQKLALLHELTHVIVGCQEGHSAKFYKIAFSLYREFKVPMAYARKREGYYRPSMMPNHNFTSLA